MCTWICFHSPQHSTAQHSVIDYHRINTSKHSHSHTRTQRINTHHHACTLAGSLYSPLLPPLCVIFLPYVYLGALPSLCNRLSHSVPQALCAVLCCAGGFGGSGVQISFHVCHSYIKQLNPKSYPNLHHTTLSYRSGPHSGNRQQQEIHVCVFACFFLHQPHYESWLIDMMCNSVWMSFIHTQVNAVRLQYDSSLLRAHRGQRTTKRAESINLLVSFADDWLEGQNTDRQHQSHWKC